MGKTRLGLKGKLYIGDTPTACKVVKDQFVLTLSKSEAEVTPLGGEWDIFRGTTKAAELSFQLLDKAGDSDVATFLDSFLNGTPIEVYALNGAIDETGASGLHAFMECMQCSRTTANKDASIYEVTLKPTEGDEDPEWHTVSGGGT